MSARKHTGPEPDRVQFGLVSLQQRSMPCWQALVDHKVVSVLGG
jgi:hypothetical protein